ncbi:PD40 domain-containing protein [candidate division KSB1 bacterium]|nr:PD40 domain-containing protein [candidate division KSB1 bacterium]
MKKSLLTLLLIWFILPGNSALKAQLVEYNHPELDWLTIETEHFFVHYHKGAERTARLTAKIAEDVHNALSEFYDYVPDTKIHWIIRDHDDYSNGITYFQDNKIEIWATAMDFELRGTHNWLRNVITHEYTHMIHIGAARKFPRQLPAIYFQLIDYEKEKRPDVLYGYPNKIISYPISGTIVPNWFAEGVAQFQLPGLNYENWDTHRDMILRTATLQDYLLTMDAMGVFGKTSIGGEMLYNQGYSMVQYIADEYGLDALQDITHKLSAVHRMTIDGALKSAIKIGENQLYRNWKTRLDTIYTARVYEISRNLVEGDILYEQGFASLYPVWSPGGQEVAFLSNKGMSYLSMTSLYTYSFETQKTKRIKGGVSSSCSWSPDGKQLIYNKKHKANRYGSYYQYLFAYDLERKTEKRLKNSARLHSPDWSPTGDKIVCVANRDGTSNLVIYDLKSDSVTYLTHNTQGEAIYYPRWSANGKVIVFSTSAANTRDIHLISADGSAHKILIADEFDSRNPVFSQDGNYIYFSYDKTGIYNIYSMHLRSGKMQQLTNVIGGAFMPTVNSRGQIAFSKFSNGKYKLCYLKTPAPIDPKLTQYFESIHDFHRKPLAKPDSAIDVSQIKNGVYDDTHYPEYETTPYKNIYAKMMFLPRVMRDYGSTKIGTYLYSSDILDRYSVLGGFGVNKDLDYDIFALFQYRKFTPTFFIELYNMTRHNDSPDTLTNGKPIHVEYGYNLIEADVGAEYKATKNQHIRLAFIYSLYRGNQEFEYKGPNKFSYSYLRGKDISLTWTYDNLLPYIHSEINPVGRKIRVDYDYEMNKFIKGFKVSSFGTFVEDYDKYYYSKIDVDWHEYWGFFSNNLGLHFRLKAGAIEKPVNSFFNFFAGGLDGMRGYPYYSIEGRFLTIGSVGMRFPVWRSMDFNLLHVYFDKLYAGVFYDYGEAFGSHKPKLSQFRQDIGVELRLDTFSFYFYPAKLFFNAAYGFNQFTHEGQIYGKEWRYYFGILFSYWD